MRWNQPPLKVWKYVSHVKRWKSDASQIIGTTYQRWKSTASQSPRIGIMYQRKNSTASQTATIIRPYMYRNCHRWRWWMYTSYVTASLYAREMQTAVVWSCSPFIRSGQNHLARHNERGKNTRQTEEEVGRQDQGMDRSGVRQVSEGSGEQGKKEKTGCKIICGAPTTIEVKG